ncbi:hypothetical protein FHG64_12360 [Antarcticibacterium flavum]|uniref:Uncharacterized protein n=1 Tax=Antarcticibacterium flavum TaxID=2058175 RepID=A0A5B7X4C9_9FLAO|nr:MULTISPECIES: hypothetical protein [Antarcticibacterium]MCM4158369.1 hypothetical protein [Antarcticibacterium sp. W02-3]QCY70130.1 hypothetical protein FHG64_12360 [Antarcticibacterium flavum]
MKWKLLIIFGFLLLPSLADAQCAMCRAVLESEGSQAAAKGINDGILYLMVFPYLLMGGIAFFIYRALRGKKTPAS